MKYVKIAFIFNLLVNLIFGLKLESQSQHFIINDTLSSIRSIVDDKDFIEIRIGKSIDNSLYQKYTKFGLGGQYSFGKLGIGLDLQLHIDENGELREEDWDETLDYLDKIYFVYGNKESDLYIRTGSLNRIRFGYSDIVNGYSNKIEYPLLKRWGIALSYQKEQFKFDFVINDVKEIANRVPSALIASRAEIKLFGKLKLGATLATDLNEYSHLIDTDGDGYTDDVDQVPTDKGYATLYELYLDKLDGNKEALDLLLASHPYDYQHIKDVDLPKYGTKRSVSAIVGLDLTYPIFQAENLHIETYTNVSKIADNGWGIALPGVNVSVGNKYKITLNADYRIGSDKFIFGYYDYNYEQAKTQSIWNDETNGIQYTTKSEQLTNIKKSNGFLVGASFSISDFLGFRMRFEHLKTEDFNFDTLFGEIYFNKDVNEKYNIHISAFLEETSTIYLEEVNRPISGFSTSVRFNTITVGYEWLYNYYKIKDIHHKAGMSSLKVRYNF